jgi:hypothetical protein
MDRRTLILCALAATAATAAGCGAGDAPGTGATAAQPAAAPAARYLDAKGLALALGNGVRTRLDQLAVMQQPPEGASDLGQDLPAGLLRDVRCTPGAAGRVRTWSCRVRWETVAGAPETTNYAVRAFATGCFAAAATPRLPDVRDPTIASFSQHPLDAVASARKGC